MTTSSIKRRRSPHDARASNDGDGLENDNDNNSSTRSSRSRSSSGSGSGSSSSALPNNSISISSNMSKRDSEEDTWASKGYSYINPFVHRIEIDSHIEVAKVSFLVYPFTRFPASAPRCQCLRRRLRLRVHSCKTAQTQLTSRCVGRGRDAFKRGSWRGAKPMLVLSIAIDIASIIVVVFV